MPDGDQHQFPLRPLTTGEAVALKNGVAAFEYTVPYFGLTSLEQGPGTNSQAVVGVYLGFIDGGAHLMGFDPDAEDWESVAVLEPDEILDLPSMAAAAKSLEKWLANRFPDDSLVFYARGNPGMN